MSEPRATVRMVNGQLVLDDPDALGIIQAIEAHNRAGNLEACRRLFEANAERVAHFKGRASALGKTPQEFVVVLIHVDDESGGVLADILMPGHDWQQYRDRGQAPVARGLADRKFVQTALDTIDKEAAERLRAATALSVVVVACGVAAVYEA